MVGSSYLVDAHSGDAMHISTFMIPGTNASSALYCFFLNICTKQAINTQV